MGTTERLGMREEDCKNAARRAREREQASQMIPSSWDWQKKAKILQACLQSFCFTLPHSRSECTRARFFVSVFIRVISGFILFFPVI
jgi:hypothetical protein